MDSQQVQKHIKRCSPSLTIMEMQTKTVIGYYHTPIKMGKDFFFFSVTRLDAGKDAEKLDYSQFAGRNE